jgi:tRNA(fMet)-specific endonuclease VapC
MQYILDADWIINALSARKNAADAIKDLYFSGIGISIATVGEVYEGAFGFPDSEKHLASFRRFLEPFTVLPLTDPIMEGFARIRAQLRRRGNLISDFDILLAATALEHDLQVLTFNTRHFERIAGLRIYRSI